MTSIEKANGPKTTMRLTPSIVAALKPRGDGAYYVTDDHVKGLQVRVSPFDGASWSIRYRFGKWRRRLTLGRVGVLTLADARTAANNALKSVAKGVDPATVKQDTREADTVGDFATTYIEKYAQKMKKSWRTDQRYLTHEILPVWKHRPMKEISRRDVRELLEGIAARPAPVVANRVRSLLSKMFNVAIQRDVAELNPVSATEKPTKEQARDRVLTADELRTFWRATETLPIEMRSAWRLRLLTAQRGGEVFGMRWQDVDLDGGWWTVPATGSKNKMAHRVALAPQALEILNALRTHTDERLKRQKEPKPSLYVFALARGKRQQGEAAATFKIDDFHGHDLRRTAASLMASTGVQRLVISKILNHVERGVTAVYDRHSYDNDKRVALDAWSRQLTAIIEKKADANVLPFAVKA